MSPQTMYIAEYKKSISATKKGILDPKSKRKKTYIIILIYSKKTIFIT